MSNYIKLTIQTTGSEVLNEILVAELAEIGFESFEESGATIYAYIAKNAFNKSICDDVFKMEIFNNEIEYTLEEIKSENWNNIWESSFEPVLIGNRCLIYASFHKNIPDVEYKIEINPKMTFGTGHHETTYLCSEVLLDTDIKNKTVLDMGCGTGILGILACAMGAKTVTAIDNDPIAVENATENAMLNNAEMNIYEGTATNISNTFDIIIANINRNILLNDMATYVSKLNNGGTIIISGFYKDDIKLLTDAFCSSELVLCKQNTRNNWAMLKFSKISDVCFSVSFP